MADILTAAQDYSDIRTRLGVTIDDLPDAEITTLGMLTIAEALVEQAITDWAAIMAGSTVNKVFLRAGTLALVAALAVRPIELRRGQSFREGDYGESETKVDWDILRAELLAESKSYLLLVSTHTHSAPKLLIVAGPTSSASNWPVRLDQWIARIQPHLTTWLDTNGVRRFGWENQP